MLQTKNKIIIGACKLITAAVHCDPGVLTRLTTSEAMIAGAGRRVAVGASIWVEPGVIVMIRFIFIIKLIAY